MKNERCKRCRHRIVELVEVNVINKYTGKNELGQIERCGMLSLPIPSYGDYDCRFFAPKEGE